MDENMKAVQKEKTVVEAMLRGSRDFATGELQRMSEDFVGVGRRLQAAVATGDQDQAPRLLPIRRPREIHINQSVNGVYIVQIGCNTWAFTDPTELSFIILTYLRNPNAIERAVDQARYGGEDAGGVSMPTVAAAPRSINGIRLPDAPR